MFQTILDLIYPVRCPVCGEIVLPKGDMICLACKKKLPYIKEPRCMKCGKPIEQEEKEYCNDCDRKLYHYDRGYAVWVYDDAMKKSIAEFKYHSKKENAKFYVAEVLRLYGEQIKDFSPDVIVPVPIHRSKLKERGYNQAELLARGIGKGLGIPVLPELLVRNKKTLPQKGLSDKERLYNLIEAFEWNNKSTENNKVSFERVLLVDDIYTTGSTVEACTNVLKSNHVSEVYFIVLCIGKGY